MNEQKNELSGIADALALYGRGGDTKLMHVTQNEIDFLATQMPGGKLTVNPHTGLPEAFGLGDIWDLAKTVGGGILDYGLQGAEWLGDWATGSPAIAAQPAVVPGLATAAQAAVPAFGGYGPALLGAGILGVNYLANRPEEGEDEIPIEEYDFSDYEAIDRFGELGARPVKEDGTPYTDEELILMDREIDRRHFT